MIQVKVGYHAAFSDITGVEEDVILAEELTLGELVTILVTRYGDPFKDLLLDPHTGDIRSGIMVLVNDLLPSRGARLHDGDEVVFLMPLAGG
jgi:molybdopterin converting factor small subunit